MLKLIRKSRVLCIIIRHAHLRRHSKRATFPVMWRARPKRKKLADFIGGPSSSKRMLAVVSATWEHVAESDSECVVVNDLRAELGKIDVYVDESDARDALDLLGRLVEEHSVALRKDIVEARDERRQTSFVLERVEISKIDARLSVRWSSLDDDSFDDEEQSDRAAHAADAHSETPGFGGKQRESLYAESLASSTRGRRLSKESGTTGNLPFGSAQSTPQRRSRVIGEDYGTMRSLLEVFAAVERSKITLPSMHIRETMTFDDFMDLLDFARSHYSRGAARNALEIAGSLRAIGNPLGLARGVLRGVEDLVREPVQGLIEGIDDQAPEAFAIGLRRGASSLVRHTVGGTANSLSQITGNFSRAASHLAMDGDYRRRQARKDNRRGNADSTRSKDAALFEGLADGFDSAVGGVVDGVTGLVQAPIRGAERGGAAGAIRGVGQGVLGLVVKPVIGVADAATDVLRGIRDTTDADAAAARAMERTPSAASLAAMSPGVVDRTERAMPHRKDAAFGLNESSAAEGRATGQAGSTETLDDGTVIREEFFDQSPARLRPTRALYGSMRWLRPYSLRDARALAALRDACREANGAESPGIDAFRDRVILYENEGGNGTATLIISDGAVAVVRSNAQPFVVTPLNLLMGCSLDAERCSVIVLVATSLKSFATSPPDRFSLRCSSITVARRACDLLAEAIVRSRDAKQSDTRRLYSANFHKKNGPSPSPSSSVEGRNGNKDR